MRRIITAAAGAAAAALLMAACGSSSASTTPGPAAGTSQAASRPAPLSALDQCVVAVDQLLVQDLNAIEAGYNGINMDQVMAQYGAYSAIFETFSQLQAQLAMDAFQYGAGSALAPVERQVRPMCRQYGADPPPSQQSPAAGQPAAPAPAPVSAPASTVPAPNAQGCPSSAQLLAAWNAAPSAARRSWTTLSPSAMSSISCWQAWVVADPVMQANGSVIFHQQNGQWRLLPETELSQFDSAVCGVPGAPAEWSGPAGPATCS